MAKHAGELVSSSAQKRWEQRLAAAAAVDVAAAAEAAAAAGGEAVAAAGVVRVRLLRGSGLKEMDPSGLSDPYVKLGLGREKRRSTTKYKTLEPAWGEAFEFRGTLRELLAGAPPLPPPPMPGSNRGAWARGGLRGRGVSCGPAGLWRSAAKKLVKTNAPAFAAPLELTVCDLDALVNDPLRGKVACKISARSPPELRLSSLPAARQGRTQERQAGRGVGRSGRAAGRAAEGGRGGRRRQWSGRARGELARDRGAARASGPARAERRVGGGRAGGGGRRRRGGRWAGRGRAGRGGFGGAD